MSIMHNKVGKKMKRNQNGIELVVHLLYFQMDDSIIESQVERVEGNFLRDHNPTVN